MKMIIRILCLLLITSCANKIELAKEFVVIAHRGASGYLPEHSLEGVAMAHAWDVDYIEADLVLTKDDLLVVLHDHHLDTTTNVATLYSKRKRKDGRYYAIDFTLAEIKRLSLSERFDHKTKKQVFANRFGTKMKHFKVPTFNEFIELIQGLNASTGRDIGIYPELKGYSFHKKEGKDILKVFMKTLKKYGLETSKKVIVQSFHPQPLIDLKDKYKSPLTRVQLIAEDSWKESEVKYYKMKSREGIKKVAEYADGIGPWLGQLKTQPEILKFARQNNLKVHAYTHRVEAVKEMGKTDFEFIKFLVQDLKLDGIFSDQADVVKQAIQQ
jgi:glycerophosphoryl diester phosphodiesterase